ncbi:beta-lactamase class A [Lactobacillus bombicola]|uniref:Beta-lactamase class A n=1 Tax=Lactobacillus bombicola TaxID=1505723 RepID=A0A1I1T8J6_9LACO|nr:serine hydrolase [Lactobacillus bombicola]RHW53353.1 serine hydrolase [Lactobacillus bombicola]SFD54944.1 beta-lactamase class A [Lactobacillus bombicola]
MKNKVFVGSIITTLLAFMLYTVNLKQTKNADIKIIGQSQKRNGNKSKSIKEPHTAEIEYPREVKITGGSKLVWAKKIKQTMGKKQSYQVYLKDLNNNQFAQVANISKAHSVNSVSRLFLLLTIYYQEQHHKLSSKTVIKVKKADVVKDEKILQPGIGYGITYLRQAMMNGSQTATNVLLRKVKLTQVNFVIKKMGLVDTKVKPKFVATTTAKDLAQIMINLYQNKTLNRQYSNRVLGVLSSVKNKPKIGQTGSGLIYAIGDKKANVALIQRGGHTYCMAILSNSDHNFSQLGKVVNKFFK